MPTDLDVYQYLNNTSKSIHEWAMPLIYNENKPRIYYMRPRKKHILKKIESLAIEI